MPSESDKVSYEKESISESFSRLSKPLFRTFVNRLQIASRLSRARRNSLEQENDVVADDHEIRSFVRQTSTISPKRTRPKSLTLRQLSKLSNGSNRNIFSRGESKLSDVSFKEDEYENGIICDGVIHFWKQFSFDEGHPYMKVSTKLDIGDVAKIMHQCWGLEVPKIVTFMISNKSHSTNWTNQRQIKNFQKGLMKAAISTNMWIFTNGINSGAAKLIGNAIKNETFKMKIKRTLDKQNLTNLIGVITEEDLKYGELLGADGEDHINIENEGISYGNKFELNEDHTHFIVMRDTHKYNKGVDTFTMNLIELLIKGPARDLVDRQSKATFASTPDSLDNPIVSIESTEVPVVSILIEGDCDCAQLVLNLIKNHIPVVILRGSGGLADMIAFAYHEMIHRCSDLNMWDSEFVEKYLKPTLSKKIISYCSDLRDNTLARNILRDRIIECVRLSKDGGRVYLTILNMHNSSSCNLENLSEYLLLALLRSRQSIEMVSTENFLKDLELTMDWNCAHVAKDVIFAKNANNIAKLDKSKFESALIRPNREEFVDLFLTLGFQLHKFLSPLRLNRLFKLIHDNEFYQTLCWESVLGRSSNSKQPKYFIENDLNWFIEICTGLENFVNTEHLHLNAMGLYPIDSLSAERKALTLLTIWAVMHNRHKLAQVFWKQSDQPVHLALVISMMFERLSWYASDNNMKSELKQKSKTFANYANGVLDACYTEDVSHANNVLNESISDWNFKTAVDIAANAHLRQFLAHPCCQKWLTNTFLGNIRIRELNWGFFTIPPAIKILLCAFLIFPMYIWVRFKADEQELNENHNKEEEFDDIYDDIYYKVGDVSESVVNTDTVNSTATGFTNPAFSKAAESIADSYDRIRARTKNHYQTYIRDREVFVRKQPPLWKMIPMMWCSPITKFYTSQISYMIFLPLLSLSVIYPSCGLWKLDVLVCSWAALIVMGYIRRTYIMWNKYTSVPTLIKCLEILLIVAYIVLFAMTRVFYVSVYNPYTQKIVLSLGVLYFYYRLISIYLPISPTLGPLLHRLKLMITVDFVNYMRIALLIIVSNGIVLQAILYPDTEISYEMFRKAFHRAFFSLFMAPVSEFETNQNCETYSLVHNKQDECTITGRYNSTSCANHGVWAYIFVSQYFIFLKLILSTLLLAIFAATASKLQTETDNIWKFQRYLLVIDFAHRLPLPAPFSLIHYIYFIYQYLCHCFCKCSLCRDKKSKKVIISNPNELQGQYKLTNDECIYWRQLASNYIEEQKEKSAKDQIAIKEWEYIQNISEDIEYEKKILREIKGKVGELERVIYSEQFSNKSSHDPKKSSQDLKSTLSLHSPYPGTRVIRVPLSDKYIPWEVMHIDYEPVAYTKPKSEFSPRMQLWVDDDILLMKELEMRKSSIRIKLPNYYWNSSEVNPAGLAINRMSWQINDDGSALFYKLENNLIPRNPFGRTGLRGRGDFPRWGPNHYVMFVITRWQKQSSSSLSNNRSLEFIIEQIENSDQNQLPECFVSGDDLFGEIQKLFKVDAKTCWVLPEVVNFFKKSCLSQETDEFSFKLIKNGYIDDPMNTDNAWKEAKIWHIHYNCREYLKKRLIESSLSWRPLSDSVFAKLPLSHTYIIKLVVDTLQANLI